MFTNKSIFNRVDFVFLNKQETMTRQEIFDKIESIWEECDERNIGENESELDFRETLADWLKPLLSDVETD